MIYAKHSTPSAEERMAFERLMKHVGTTLLFAALTLPGCAGEGESKGGDGDGAFATIQREIFNQSCVQASCHDSITQQGGLDLSAAVSYDNLVGVEPQNPVARADGLLRVAPGSDADSFIMRKLTGELSPGEGAPMPLGSSRLPANDIEMVRSWIASGAPRD